MKKAVVAINLGGYDDLHDPTIVNPNWDYVYLTDREYESHIWKMRCLPPMYPNDIVTTRWWICHLDLLGYDYIVKIDGNIVLNVCPEELLKYLKSDMAFFRHPVRDCLYDESDLIIDLGIDYEDVIRNQMSRYRGEGFPKHFGLSAGGGFAFKNTSLTRKFFRMWWEEIKNGSKRNQLSFDYVRWRLGIEIGYFPESLFSTDWVSFSPHNKKYQGVRGTG